MPPRTVDAPPQAWEALAAVLRARRDETGLTVDDVIARSKASTPSGVSRSVVSYLENAKQTSYLPRTLRAMSVGLGWDPNAIELIIGGANPDDLPWSLASGTHTRTDRPPDDDQPSRDTIDVTGLSPEHRLRVEGYIRALLDTQMDS